VTYARYRYPSMTRTEGKFKLRVIEGEFTDSEIIVLLGENGTGKTTFMRMLVLFIFLFFPCVYSYFHLPLKMFSYHIRSHCRLVF
jgi:ABC-type Na+ transport system ATPase subunit NatA